MMVVGIGGMVSVLIATRIFGGMQTRDWVQFCIWAVVAVCGAIKEAR